VSEEYTRPVFPSKPPPDRTSRGEAGVWCIRPPTSLAVDRHTKQSVGYSIADETGRKLDSRCRREAFSLNAGHTFAIAAVVGVGERKTHKKKSDNSRPGVARGRRTSKETPADRQDGAGIDGEKRTSRLLSSSAMLPRSPQSSLAALGIPGRGIPQAYPHLDPNGPLSSPHLLILAPDSDQILWNRQMPSNRRDLLGDPFFAADRGCHVDG
jgi:hypothetical protein